MGEVSVRLTGRLEVRGAPGSAGPGGPTPRRLLALLAVHRRRTVPTPEIVDALWPDTAPRRPERAVATLVSRLRAAYGPELVGGGGPGYRLGPAVRVDVDEAADLVDRCTRERDPAPGLRALDLLAEESLLIGEPDAEWTRPARDAFAALLRRARTATAEAALARGDPATALGALGPVDPLDEPAHVLLMRATAAAGDRAGALQVYERLRAALADELGVPPSTASRAAHTALLTEVATGASPQRPPTALAGRDAERARLTAAWRAARTSGTRVVLIVGEGGIGKTALAAGLAAEVAAEGARVLDTRCYACERSLFLQPLADVLPDVAADGDDLRRVFTGVAGRLAERPTLLVLDDLHNAGLSTVELLHFLARRGPRRPLLVVGTLRAAEGREALDVLAEVTDRIELGPLDAPAVARLAAAAGRPDLAATITDRTRGHTLFVVETLRGLAAGGTGVPETLQAVVLARLRRVGREGEEVLRAGAVLGAALDPGVVAAMLGREPVEVARRCEAAVAEGLLVLGERTYEFANDLVQEVLYASTAPPLRIAHHRRAADLLAAAPETLAGHALAAGDHARAARALLVAADRAVRAVAHADAEVLLGRALTAARTVADDELVARVLLARGQVREALGTWADALADLRAATAAAESAGDLRLEMVIARERGGHVAVAFGQPLDGCERHLDRALRLAGELGDRAAEARTLAWSAILATNRLRFAEAVALGRRAVAAGRAAGTDAALVAALDGLKTPYAYLGAVGPLQEVLAELGPLLGPAGLGKLEIWAAFESAFPAIAAADWATVERRLAEADALCGDRDQPAHRSWLTAHRGWVHRLRGRLDDAVRDGAQAVSEAARRPHRWFGPCAAAHLGTTLIEAGRPAEAEQILARGLEQARAEAYRLRCLGPLALVTGSRELLAEADGLVAGITAPPGEAWLLGADAVIAVAEAWRGRGDPARARAVLAPLLAAARGRGWVPVEVLAGRADAAAAEGLGLPAAAALAGAATALARRSGMPA
ncbi:ATP-binding protein [Pseudonocardia xishanensis]|uniref:OmpR/PhoB-type domain-containing protein n=1 Tax=Pseudonocardia xishanensis TaxID=630995 RepID=A0ABP8S4X4_9PSEU